MMTMMLLCIAAAAAAAAADDDDDDSIGDGGILTDLDSDIKEKKEEKDCSSFLHALLCPPSYSSISKHQAICVFPGGTLVLSTDPSLGLMLV